jgi:HSP20 family protein
MPDIVPVQRGRLAGGFDLVPDFTDFWTRFWSRPAVGAGLLEPEIKMDVTESDGSYVVKAEVPGVAKEDIDVSIKGDVVTIRAEVKKEKEEKGKNFLRIERYYGQQSRTFTLGAEIDEGKAEAIYRNGVLQLTLPKKPGTQARKLTVS